MDFYRRRSTPASDMEIVPAHCPACENDGWYEIYSDVHAEADDEGYSEYSTWVIDQFKCPICNLHLPGDQLHWAGMNDDANEIMAEHGGNPNDEDDAIETAKWL
jgi:hypothetical protein